MTSRIREEADDEVQMKLDRQSYYWRASTEFKFKTNYYLFQDSYMIPLLPVLECTLKSDQIWPSHIQANPLSTRIIFMKFFLQLSVKKLS